jgi:DNA-directed RNA polymerase subunit RPC12/RpoP
MNKRILFLLTFLALSALLVQTAAAQEQTPLTISVNKNFGYNDFSGRIQGSFSVRAVGPDDLARVIFFIDGETLAEDNEPPFRASFETASYPVGVHAFTALGYTTSGQELASNEVRKEFISGSEGMGSTLKIILPILAVVGGAILLSAFFSIRVGKRKLEALPPGAPRSYGMLGGTICPKCGRPFGVHMWGLNLLVGKLDRCPYCGKWSLVVRHSPDALRQAELAELKAAQETGQFQAPSEEERLRKELDESRYQDS